MLDLLLRLEKDPLRAEFGRNIPLRLPSRPDMELWFGPTDDALCAAAAD